MVGNKKLLYKPPPAQDYSANFCKLYIVIAISFIFIAGEFVGGYISGSIAVISDAFHLVTDLIGFGISFFFIYFSRREPTAKMSFGFHRMEIVGALANLFIIWFLAIFMIYEATDRIMHKQFVEEPLAMLIVGVAGLAINIVMYFVLHTGGHSHGLMSESCDHHQEPHDNDPNPSNCTTSFCNELLCDDEDCLKQINYSHCHPKNQKGNPQVHIHNPKRKISEDIEGHKGEDAQNSMMNLDQDKKKSSCLPGCQQDHEHELNKKHNHSHNDLNNQNYDHNGNGNPNLKSQKGSNKNGRHQKIEAQNFSIELKTSNKPKKQAHSHEHGQNCKHDHGDKKHGHKHDHKQNHKHDHKNDNKNENSHDHAHDHDHSHNHGQQNESIGMKAAILHALSDVIQSIGLLISSFIIFFLGSDKGARVEEWNDWHYFDPISTYIFSVIVIVATFPIVKNCYYLIMQATPSTDVALEIKRQFEQTPGVVDVHDLHIWSLRPGKNILIAHVFAKDGAQREVLTGLTQICRRKKIFHSTLQVEEENWKDHEEYILCDHDIH